MVNYVNGNGILNPLFSKPFVTHCLGLEKDIQKMSNDEQKQYCKQKPSIF